MEPLHVTVILTKQSVDQAARHFVWRFLPRALFGDFVFLCTGAILGLGGVISRGFAVAWIVAALGIIAFVLLVARNYVRSSKAKFDAMTSPEITYSGTQTTFATKSCLGNVEVPWKTITEIWRFEEVWLLFFGNHGYSLLPVNLIGMRMAKFVQEQVKANGGKVSDGPRCCRKSSALL